MQVNNEIGGDSKHMNIIKIIEINEEDDYDNEYKIQILQSYVCTSRSILIDLFKKQMLYKTYMQQLLKDLHYASNKLKTYTENTKKQYTDSTCASHIALREYKSAITVTNMQKKYDSITADYAKIEDCVIRARQVRDKSLEMLVKL